MSEIVIDRDVCPCGSGRLINACCVKPCGSLLPRAPQSLIINPRCYARRTRDCSTKLTREHPVSAGVLSILAAHGPIHVTGLPGQAAGEIKLLSPQSIASKILCDRHNASLSPLDTLAKRFFTSFPHVSPSLSPQEDLRLFQGHDLERWMLKTMCGVICSKYAQGAEMPEKGWQPNVELLEALLLGMPLSFPAGLYFAAEPGEVINIRPRVEVSVFAKSGKPQGIALVLHGLRFSLALEEPSTSFLTKAKYRPNGIEFQTPQGKVSMLFFWGGSHIGATANLTIQSNAVVN